MKELPLPYVPIDPMLHESERFQDFVELAELYDDPYAEFYIHKLLLFAGRARVTGNLGSVSPRRLKHECRWPHEPERLVNALKGAGWLVEDESGNLRIEGWERHGGRVLKERERWRNQKRQQRGSTDPEDPEPDVHEESTGTSARTPRDVPALKGEDPPPPPTRNAQKDDETPRPPYTAGDLTPLAKGWGWGYPHLKPKLATRARALGNISEQHMVWAREAVEERVRGEGGDVAQCSVNLLVHKLEDARKGGGPKRSGPGPPRGAKRPPGRGKEPFSAAKEGEPGWEQNPLKLVDQVASAKNVRRR